MSSAATAAMPAAPAPDRSVLVLGSAPVPPRPLGRVADDAPGEGDAVIGSGKYPDDPGATSPRNVRGEIADVKRTQM